MPSPFDLDPEETQLVYENIAHHRQVIVELDNKISSLVASIEFLQKTKADHLQQMRRCQSVLTLARRLPPDLLGHIFEYCADIYPMAPLVISQVCSSWRFAAQNTPRIWSSLIVDCARPNVGDRTAYWLKMSGNHIPLQILLVLRDACYLQPGLDILLGQASRWKHFTVNAVHSSDLRKLLEYLEAEELCYFVLETVTLTIQEEADDAVPLNSVFSSEYSPSLSAIRLNSESLQPTILPNHLTTLTLSIFRQHVPPAIHIYILQVLRALPRLVNFCLNFSDGSFTNEASEVPGDEFLVLPHLESLTLIGDNSLFEILAYLTLPALHNLALRATGKDAINIPAMLGPWFLDMISRSDAPINVLELYSVDLSDDDFIQCFFLLPTLQELLLHDSEISNNVLHALFLSAEHQRLCPMLRRVELRWCSYFSGAMLVELVRSRLGWAAATNIDEIIVIYCSGVREEDVLSLAGLTICRLKHSREDFCYCRGCCINGRYRHRFLLRHLEDLKITGLTGRLIV